MKTGECSLTGNYPGFPGLTLSKEYCTRRLKNQASGDKMSIKQSQETEGAETAIGHEDEIEVTRIEEKGTQRGEEEVIGRKMRV